jgi:alanyl-tRNA synthetase
VKAFTTEYSAELMKQLHPLRVSRYSFSDFNPFMIPIKISAPHVKANRKAAKDDNMFLHMEREFSKAVELWLDAYGEMRDCYSELTFNLIYTNPWVKLWFSQNNGEEQDKELVEAAREKRKELERIDSERWMNLMDKGGFPEGVIRIMLAAANADRRLERSEFEMVEKIGKARKEMNKISKSELKKIAKEQSRIIQTDHEQAISSLPKLLPTKKDRTKALEIAQEIIMADGVLADEEKLILEKIKKIFSA